MSSSDRATIFNALTRNFKNPGYTIGFLNMMYLNIFLPIVLITMITDYMDPCVSLKMLNRREDNELVLYYNIGHLHCDLHFLRIVCSEQGLTNIISSTHGTKGDVPISILFTEAHRWFSECKERLHRKTNLPVCNDHQHRYCLYRCPGLISLNTICNVCFPLNKKIKGLTVCVMCREIVPKKDIYITADLHSRVYGGDATLACARCSFSSYNS